MSSATEVSTSSVRDVNWYRQLWWNTGNFHPKAKWNDATNSESLEETVTNLSRSDHVYTNTSEVSGLEQDDEIDVVDTSQIIEQGLIQELTQNQYEVACQSNSTSSDDEINKS
ncbi:6813_t:CDS:2, partial [Acaulospora morrowiae]